MQLPLLLGKAADPASPSVIVSVPPQDTVHLIDQTKGTIAIPGVSGPAE
jgi:hypothetical protein